MSCFSKRRVYQGRKYSRRKSRGRKHPLTHLTAAGNADRTRVIWLLHHLKTVGRLLTIYQDWGSAVRKRTVLQQKAVGQVYDSIGNGVI